jgi:glycosyltransferase involved in cell wall biosynthesis
VVIPALNEEASIGRVVSDVRDEVGAEVIVVDNGSRDRTVDEAERHGARVVFETRRGYGWACRTGCAAAADNDIVVIIDGDGSMAAADIRTLLAPIFAGEADLVCGARPRRSASMPWHQRAGNRVIGLMLRAMFGLRHDELGPFRAVRLSTLAALNLPGSRYAWPAQMLARASRAGVAIAEVQVGYHDRTGGHSKIGGTIRGSVGAASAITAVLIAERLR